MSRYNSVNVLLSENQAKKLVDAIRNNSTTTLRIDPRMLNSQDGSEIYLTNTQIDRLSNAISPINIKLSRAQLREMSQSGGFLPALLPAAITAAKFLGPALASGGLSWLAEKGLKKITGGNLGSGREIKLCITSNELEDIVKIIAAMEESGVLMEGHTQNALEKIERQEGGFLGPIFGSMAASALSNKLTQIARNEARKAVGNKVGDVVNKVVGTVAGERLGRKAAGKASRKAGDLAGDLAGKLTRKVSSRVANKILTGSGGVRAGEYFRGDGGS